MHLKGHSLESKGLEYNNTFKKCVLLWVNAVFVMIMDILSWKHFRNWENSSILLQFRTKMVWLGGNFDQNLMSRMSKILERDLIHNAVYSKTSSRKIAHNTDTSLMQTHSHVLAEGRWLSHSKSSIRWKMNTSKSKRGIQTFLARCSWSWNY